MSKPRNLFNDKESLYKEGKAPIASVSFGFGATAAFCCALTHCA